MNDDSSGALPPLITRKGFARCVCSRFAIRIFRTEKNALVEVYKNLAKYRSENNIVGPSK